MQKGKENLRTTTDNNYGQQVFVYSTFLRNVAQKITQSKQFILLDRLRDVVARSSARFAV